MKINSIRYPLTNTVLDNNDIKSGINVLKSKWITMGRETLKFEKHFPNKFQKDLLLWSTQGLLLIY